MIEQLVFGYDEGHRLLNGSTDLKSKTVAALLGATDAAPGSDTNRLVTAMPLHAEKMYALCFTWTAPEVSRPGAVWAHVLLAPSDLIGSAADPFALAKLARRPTPSTLKRYSAVLDQAEDTPEPSDVPIPVLEDVLAAAFLTGNSSISVEQDLELAERALAMAWRVQWPALRNEFSFRTRDGVRDANRATVTVARRLRGPSRRLAKPVRPPWVTSLAEELVSIESDTPLVDFLREFGVFDAAEPASVERLGAVYDALRAGTPTTVRDAISAAYPTTESGRSLKWAVFGGELPEAARRRSLLVALLGSGVDGWDELQLHLPEQIAQLMSEIGPAEVASALAPVPASRIRSAFRIALEQRSEPADLPPLTAVHLDLVLELVAEDPALLEAPGAWQGVSAGAAAAMLTVPDQLSDAAIGAAIAAGLGPVVSEKLGVARSLSALAATGDYRAARSFVRELPAEAVALAAAEDKRIAVLAAAAGGGQRKHAKSLIPALQAGRGQPDEFWLRAAVASVADTSLDRRQVLRVVFGPLHEAMTSDRLPRDCWRSLDQVLPDAPDPAQRLRRYLIAEARQGEWSDSDFRQALDGAGPYASQLRHDFQDSGDDWIVSVGKAVLRAIGLMGK